MAFCSRFCCFSSSSSSSSSSPPSSLSLASPFPFLPPQIRTQERVGLAPPVDFPSLQRTLLSPPCRPDADSSLLEENDSLPVLLPSLASAIRAFDAFVADPHRTFFASLLPCIHRWASDYKDSDRYIPLLHARSGSRSTATTVPDVARLSRKRIRTLLSNAFFLNTLRVGTEDGEECPFGNLSLEGLYRSKHNLAVERILCMLSYFAQAEDEGGDEDEDKDERLVSFERHAYSCGVLAPDWASSEQPVSLSLIRISTGSMENASDASAFVDFANKALHIHSVIPSATQEEVLFSACPEALPGILFCEVMQDDEVIIIRNVRRFSTYTGYAHTFRFAGFYPVVRYHDILAMDASYSRHFQESVVRRDLNKAYLAFASAYPNILNPSNAIPNAAGPGRNEVVKVSTSHWGCGIFGGEIHAKFLQQVCAAAHANVFLYYSTFGNSTAAEHFRELLGIIEKEGKTVGDIYHALISFSYGKEQDFYHYITHKLSKK